MAKPDEFAIFQPSDNEKKFKTGAYAEMLRTNHPPTSKEYTQVYTAQLSPGVTPYKIMQIFTVHVPQGMQGHTVRVGDVIVVRQNGSITAYFVDLGTLIILPDFFPTKKNSLNTNIGVDEKTTVQNRKSLKKNLAKKAEAVKRDKPSKNRARAQAQDLS